MMRLSSVLLLVSTLLAGSEATKSLVFPTETATSYVELVPLKPLTLQAFTLCMRVATELTGKREIILFAYRTWYFDELNVWREMDGRLSLYLAGEGVAFTVPQIGAMQTHVCITWNSASGATAVFVDGKKSLTKIYKKSHVVRPWGKVILGQDPDAYLGDFDPKQSFVGEIGDVNMWDSVLPDAAIVELFSGERGIRGNVLDWETIKMSGQGEVVVVNSEL